MLSNIERLLADVDVSDGPEIKGLDLLEISKNKEVIGDELFGLYKEWCGCDSDEQALLEWQTNKEKLKEVLLYGK